MRTHQYAHKRRASQSSCISVPRPSEVQSSVQPPQIQARSNEVGLAEHAERLKKFQRLGSSMIQMGPPRLDNDNTSSLQLKPCIQRKLMVSQIGDKAKLLQGKFSNEEIPTLIQSDNTSSENQTGMPDLLKTGLEQLSGLDMSDVRVHYNSTKPAHLNAFAYTQGLNIEVGPGQERHLPHEGWHVVQQMQGRVQPTIQVKGSSINNDAALEREADVMGEKAIQMKQVGGEYSGNFSDPYLSSSYSIGNVKQCVFYNSEANMWAAVEPATPLKEIRDIINGNIELRSAYEDSLVYLNKMNFVQDAGRQPNASHTQNGDGSYDINYGLRATQEGQFTQPTHFIWAIIHEMGHVSSAFQYKTNIAPGELYHLANMHLPAAVGPTFPSSTIGVNQSNAPLHGWKAQRKTMEDNWAILETLRTGDHGFSDDEITHLKQREEYAQGVGPETHYDTVLTDILYFLQATGLTETHYYAQATAMLREANLRRRAGFGDVATVALVGAPVNSFLSLYNAVTDLLNIPLWVQEGETLVGHKVPSGIASMRDKLTVANKRDALNEIKDIAVAQAAVASKRRSESTQSAYDVLSDLGKRNDFDKLIANITVCKRFIGKKKLELDRF